MPKPESGKIPVTLVSMRVMKQISLSCTKLRQTVLLFSTIPLPATFLTIFVSHAIGHWVFRERENHFVKSCLETKGTAEGGRGGE